MIVFVFLSSKSCNAYNCMSGKYLTSQIPNRLAIDCSVKQFEGCNFLLKLGFSFCCLFFASLPFCGISEEPKAFNYQSTFFHRSILLKLLFWKCYILNMNLLIISIGSELKELIGIG